jgi:hypothetical protein
MTVSFVPAVLTLGAVSLESISISWTGAEGSPRENAYFAIERRTSTPLSSAKTGGDTLSGPTYTIGLIYDAEVPDVVPGTAAISVFVGAPGGTPDDVLTDNGQGGLTGAHSSGTIEYQTGVCVFTSTLTLTNYTAAWDSYVRTGWTSVASVAINVSSYANTGLTGRTTYYYRVRALDNDSTCGWSYWLEATTVDTPAGIGTIYRIYDGTSTTRTGTVTLNGTTSVVGSGTAFGSEFSVGDVIEVNNEARRIASISNDTSLTVGSAFTQSATGQVYTGYHIVAVTSLAMDMLEPNSTPQTYSAARALLDGTVRGLGWSTTEWKWGFITAAQHAAFKALCPGKSVLTFIDTRDDNDEFLTYRAVMVLPDKSEIYAHHWLNFTLGFRKMEQL